MADEDEPSLAPSSPIAEEEPSGSSLAGGGSAQLPVDSTELSTWRSSFETAQASQTTLTSGWRGVCREYEALFAAYSASLREIRALKAQLAEAMRAAAESPSAASSTTSTSWGLGAAAAAERECAQLRRKLIEAQELLLQEREKERRAVQDRLRLVEANQRLSEEAGRAVRGAERCEAQRASLVAAEAQASAAALAASQQLTVLRGEVLALREDNRRVSAMKDDLLHTTSSLTSTRLSTSSDLASELNASNEERRVVLRGREVLEGRLADAAAKVAAGEALAAQQEKEILSLRREVMRWKEAAGAAAAGSDSERGSPPAEAAAAAAEAPLQAAEQPDSAATASSSSSRGAPAASASAPPSSLPPSLRSGLSEAKSLFTSLVSSASSAWGGLSKGAAAAAAAATATTAATPAPLPKPPSPSLIHAGLATGSCFSQISFSELPIPSRQQHRLALGSRPVSSLLFLDPAGQRLAAGEGSKVYLLDLSTALPSVAGTLLVPQKGVDVAALACSPRLLFGGASDGELFHWDPATRQCVRTIPSAHSGSVSALAYLAMEASLLGGGGGGASAGGGSVGGGLLCSGATMDTQVRLWDVRSQGNRPVRALNARSHVNSICLGGEGGSLLVGTVDGRVRSYDLRSGSEAVCYSPAAEGGVQPPWVTGLSVAQAPRSSSGSSSASSSASSPSHWLLATLRDSGGGTHLRLLDALTLAPLPACPGELRHAHFSAPSRVSRAIFSPCSRHAIAPGADGRLYVWGTGSGEFEVCVGGGGGGGGGKRGAAASRRKGSEEGLFGGAFAELREEEERGAHAPVGHAGAVTSCAYAAEGGVLASGDANGLVCTWEAPQQGEH